jgi:hypothetical protein
MHCWYRRRLGEARLAYVALRRLKALQLQNPAGPINMDFYKVGLERETGDVIIFIKPGNSELAEAFGAEVSPAPRFGTELMDVTVAPSPAFNWFCDNLRTSDSH